ncbi:glycosyltransferase [Streptomyces sp. NPDC014685]|uniref:glycosyltransferase n=1 Tax=Streptomyces sp. NPDC014685 TaxID=3364881 RepID=UPI0036F97AB7
MRIGLLTEGGYPYPNGESGLWCDRLVRGIAQHEFDLFTLSRSAEQGEQGWGPLPMQVGRVRTAPMWTADEGAPGTRGLRGPRGRMRSGGGARPYGRRERQRFTAHLTALASAVCAADGARAEDGPLGGAGDVRSGGAGGSGGVGGSSGAGAGRTVGGAVGERFAQGLYGLAELAREHGGPAQALRSETAVRALEAACHAPGAGRTVQAATVPDLLVFARELDRALHPLSLDWYDEEGLGAVDLCHATSGGVTALPGLLGKRFFGVPLLVTEYGARLRPHHLAATGSGSSAPVRALRAGFHRLLAAEVYRQAAIVTSGDAHARRWQERCGAGREKLRTVHPGMESDRFTELGESGDGGPDDTLVWVGRIEPGKDLVTLLRAFAEVRGSAPAARLRIIGTPAGSPEGAAYLVHCRALADRLFPAGPFPARQLRAGAAGAGIADGGPVSFEDPGATGAADPAKTYGAAGVVVLSSVAEGFPTGLVEAMLCGRATVSTDVGAVVEAIGGTGLVVPPGNPGALADACLALLRDPERRARLGAAARARALELFTVEQNLAAFRGIYLELMAHAPVRRKAGAGVTEPDGGPRPFAVPPEAHVMGPWTDPYTARADRTPSWAAGPRTVCAGAWGAGGTDA